MAKNKKENIKVSEETKKFIKTFIIVVIVFAGLYLLFLLLSKVGMFDRSYEKPEIEEAEFTYNTAIIGTVFNRPETEYYVAFIEEEKNVYFESLIELNTTGINIYTVDMSLGINSEYLSVESNPKAKVPSQLSIVCPTLIKIKNGRIVKYFDEISKIEKELQG